jgi:hypothetical protein
VARVPPAACGQACAIRTPATDGSPLCWHGECPKLLPDRALAPLRPEGYRVKEYQAVVIRLSRHLRDDEDALTDLLNERSRGGWEPAMMSQDTQRLTVVFSREVLPEG